MEQKSLNKEFWLQTISAAISILVALGGIYLVLKATGNTNDKPEDTFPVGTTTPISVQPSDYPDYDSLQTLRSVVIATSTTSSEADKTVVEGGITQHLLITGQFSRLYLYAETSVDDKPLTDWDSLYMKVANLGGHLYRPDSLATPTDNKVTRLLFNTSVIPYLQTLPYSSARTPVITNWFDNVFNAHTGSVTPWQTRADAFISTTRNGTIHLIAFYYACADSSPECFIEVK